MAFKTQFSAVVESNHETSLVGQKTSKSVKQASELTYVISSII